MKKSIVLILFSLSSCMLTADKLFDKTNDTPPRPAGGYDRTHFKMTFNDSQLIPYYKYSGISKNPKTEPSIITKIKNRKSWNATNPNFRKVYPEYNIELLVINQYAEREQQFTWQERIVFSDALELLTFAINSPIFKEEMMTKTFYTGDKPCDVVKDIRGRNFKLILGKNSLGSGVAAEASMNGYSYTIWFKDSNVDESKDRKTISYTNQNIVYIAMVLGHELTHNMGYSHPGGVPHSNTVPYGVHSAILKAIAKATDEQINEFIAHTPYFENDFLYRTRSLKHAPKPLNNE